jgi:hypothetical protein
MISALAGEKFVRALALLLIAAVCLLLLVDAGATGASVWAKRGWFLLGLTLFLAALEVSAIYRVFHKITFADLWLFPLLDGKWDAVLTSNWPRIRRTYETAKNGGPTFDALVDSLTPTEEQERLNEAEVTFKSTLFHISMTLRPKIGNRVSRTRFARPMWRKPDLPELSYVFEQEDPDPISQTDDRRHYGAGVIRFDPEDQSISGEYWNNRKEAAGLNTAGTIRITRKPKP